MASKMQSTVVVGSMIDAMTGWKSIITTAIRCTIYGSRAVATIGITTVITTVIEMYFAVTVSTFVWTGYGNESVNMQLMTRVTVGAPVRRASATRHSRGVCRMRIRTLSVDSRDPVPRTRLMR